MSKKNIFRNDNNKTKTQQSSVVFMLLLLLIFTLHTTPAKTTETTTVAATSTTMSTALPVPTLATSCWSVTATKASAANALDDTKPDICTIHATLFMTPPTKRDANDFGLPLDIDCAELGNAAQEVSLSFHKEHLAAARNAGKPHVLLDGCHAPLNAQTFGLEYLSHCTDVLSATIERFHGDKLAALHCVDANGTGMRLQELQLRHNEIATIDAASLWHATQLRKLYFEANMLRYIDADFQLNATLELLSIAQEEHLMLKNPAIFARLQVFALELRALKGIVAQLFENLPALLVELRVHNTPIEVENGVTVQLLPPAKLSRVELVHCGLTTFQLPQPNNVQYLNLSGNALQKLHIWAATPSSATQLRQLDLSANRLAHLPMHWFANLTQLQQLQLNHNQFKTLDLAALVGISKRLQFIDLRANQLEHLAVAERLPLHYEQTRIQIERNPWRCLWLLNFTHTQPEKFRIFQYDKFITHINVNGLACVPQETNGTAMASISTSTERNATESNDGERVPQKVHSYMNVSTYTLVYGSPFEVKRNQKQEALIIVFLLPLGIALLFVLLYLWIKCQKLFHLSYYRGCGSWRKTNPQAPRFIERFDVVRYPTCNTQPGTLMSNGDVLNAAYEDGYELPLNGRNSICNCQQLPQAAGTCQKTLHVTYEPLPQDRAYQVYSEIKEPAAKQANDKQDETALADALPNNTIYDHLSFIETMSEP